MSAPPVISPRWRIVASVLPWSAASLPQPTSMAITSAIRRVRRITRGVCRTGDRARAPRGDFRRTPETARVTSRTSRIREALKRRYRRRRSAPGLRHHHLGGRSHTLGGNDRQPAAVPLVDALVEHDGVGVAALAELVDDDARQVMRTAAG